MKYVFVLLCMVFATLATAQTNCRLPLKPNVPDEVATGSEAPNARPVPTPPSPQERFATWLTQLHASFDAQDFGHTTYFSSKLLGAMRDQIGAQPQKSPAARKRMEAILLDFDGFTFEPAKPVEANPKFVLLEEFQRLMAE